MTAITHRKDPVLQALHPTSQEVALLCGPAGEAEIVQTLRDKGFAVEDLALSTASGRTHVALSVRKRHDSDAKQVLHFLLAGMPYIKHPVTVDRRKTSAIRKISSGQSPRAFKTMLTWSSFPTCAPEASIRRKKEGMFTAKVGIDATVPIAERRRFKRIACRRKLSKASRNALRRL